MVETYVQAGEEEYVDDVDEFQTYDIEGNLLDVSGTPMMDLSVRPPKRVPPLIEPLLHRSRDIIIHDRFSRPRPRA